MSDDNEYRYQLVRFVEGSQSNTSEYDCIPTSWLLFDRNSNSCSTKYPPPPYNAKVISHLHNLVKNCANPDKKWPLWTVTIQGGANTYTKAVKRLQKFRKQPFVYTTDSDVQPEQKAKKSIDKISKNTLKELMKVPQMNNSSVENENTKKDFVDFDTKETSSMSNLEDKSDCDELLDIPKFTEVPNKPKKIPASNTFSKETKTLLAAIAGIRFDISQIAIELKNIKAELRHRTPIEILTIRQLNQDYNLNLPLKTKEEFEEFENKFAEEGFQQKFNKAIYNLIERTQNTNKNITNI